MPYGHRTSDGCTGPALIWSKYPQTSRDQVRDRLIWAGQGVLESGLGNGIVDAYKVVGWMYALNVSGPSAHMVQPNAPFTLTAPNLRVTVRSPTSGRER